MQCGKRYNQNNESCRLSSSSTNKWKSFENIILSIPKKLEKNLEAVEEESLGNWQTASGFSFKYSLVKMSERAKTKKIRFVYGK